jgi:uncharacterized membrane protein
MCEKIYGFKIIKKIFRNFLLKILIFFNFFKVKKISAKNNKNKIFPSKEKS